MNVFRGIPYGKPPRFAPPEPVAWEGVHDASKFGKTCPQPLDGWPSIQGAKSAAEDCLFINVLTPTTTPTSPLPVMVYIHAGEFVYGSSNDLESNQSPSATVVFVSFNFRVGPLGFFAAEWLRTAESKSVGNYGMLDQQFALKWVQDNINAFGGDKNRVTIFGESSGASSVAYHVVNPSSWGLFQRAVIESPGLTQTKSLKQAEANTNFIISSLADKKSEHCTDFDRQWELFTGIMVGETVGTVNGTDRNQTVELAKAKCDDMVHCSGFTFYDSPAIGKFSLVLKAGGMAIYNMAATKAFSSYMRVVVNATGEMARDCAMSADGVLLNQQGDMVPFGDTALTDSWAPVVDGVALTHDIVTLLNTGSVASGIQVIIGSNLDEGTMFMSLTPRLDCNSTYEQFEAWAGEFLGEENAKKVTPLYQTLEKPVPLCRERHHTAESRDTGWDGHAAATRLAGDLSVTCGARLMARALVAKPGNDVFVYSFNHQPNSTININGSLAYWGAFHGAEVPFVFNDTFELTPDGEQELSNTMSCYWSRFAGSGDPNSDSLLCPQSPHPAHWPPYLWSGSTAHDPDEDVNIVFDVSSDRTSQLITTQVGKKRQECDILSPLLQA